MRDADLAFSPSFIAQTGAPGDAIEAFRGRRFAFGPKLSTSGHLMPRHFLAQQNIVPETFFSAVRYSDNHDATAARARNGVVDLGVVNSLALTQMYRSELLRREAVRVVWETPTYPDYVWVAQPDLEPTRASTYFRGGLRLCAHRSSGRHICCRTEHGHDPARAAGEGRSYSGRLSHRRGLRTRLRDLATRPVRARTPVGHRRG